VLYLSRLCSCTDTPYFAILTWDTREGMQEFENECMIDATAQSV
jgi:hypothetical protein